MYTWLPLTSSADLAKLETELSPEYGVVKFRAWIAASLRIDQPAPGDQHRAVGKECGRMHISLASHVAGTSEGSGRGVVQFGVGLREQCRATGKQYLAVREQG